MKSDKVSMWFYDRNEIRVAKEQVSIVDMLAHEGFFSLDGVMYETEYNRMTGGHYCCNEIEPLVIREVIEGLE